MSPIFVELIGRGNAKLVYREVNNTDVVYYTHRFPWKEAELQEEFKTTQNIKRTIENANKSTEHLAVNINLNNRITIEGKSVFQTEQATEGDLEKVIRRNDLLFKDRMHIALDCLNGFSALHATHHVHGDIKLDNILVFNKDGRLTAKINDWGKTKVLADVDTQLPYKGNARFAPPEYQTSFKGEVYSVGLILLRIFEEAILSKQSPQEDMLIKPLKTRSLFLESNLRGFIKYFYSNSTSSYPFRIKWIKRFIAWWNRNNIQKKEQDQKIAYEYIDKLSNQMLDKKLCSEKTAENIAALIKAMLHFDPKKRPSAQVAYEFLQDVSRIHDEKTTPLPNINVEVESEPEAISKIEINLQQKLTEVKSLDFPQEEMEIEMEDFGKSRKIPFTPNAAAG